jgi:glutaredoxin-related protein
LNADRATIYYNLASDKAQQCATFQVNYIKALIQIEYEMADATGVACLNLGRKFIEIELDRTTFENARKNLASKIN